MADKEKTELKKLRDYKVAKKNDLVFKTRYDFSVNEQKTLAYICSMIKPVSAIDKAEKKPFILDYELSISEYARICNITTGGKIYQEVKSALKKLADKSMWYTNTDGSESLVRWIKDVDINKGNSLIKVKLDEDRKSVV